MHIMAFILRPSRQMFSTHSSYFCRCRQTEWNVGPQLDSPPTPCAMVALGDNAPWPRNYPAFHHKISQNNSEESRQRFGGHNKDRRADTQKSWLYSLTG